MHGDKNVHSLVLLIEVASPDSDPTASERLIRRENAYLNAYAVSYVRLKIDSPPYAILSAVDSSILERIMTERAVRSHTLVLGPLGLCRRSRGAEDVRYILLDLLVNSFRGAEPRYFYILKY